MRHVFVCAGVSAMILSAGTASAQTAGDLVNFSFEASNSSGFDTFPGNREYDIVESTVSLDINGIIFGSNSAGNLSVTDSTPLAGFPFEDGFEDAGGGMDLTDPNFDVNDGLGEGMSLDFFAKSDSATNNLFSSNILTDLIGLNLLAPDFQFDPGFPFDTLQMSVTYTPPMQSGEKLQIDIVGLTTEAGANADQVRFNFRGIVASNDILTPGSSLSIPSPGALAVLGLGGLASIRRRR